MHSGEEKGERDQFSSVAQSCPTLCDPTDWSMPGLPVHHQLPEFTQTHVHWVGDAIQPSHPLSSPSPAFNLSQHWGLFKWVSSLHQVVKILGVSASTSALPMNIQDWFPLGWTGWICLQFKGLSRVFSNIIVQKQQFYHSSKAAILRSSAFFIGEGNGNPLQYSCLESPVDGGAWWAAIYGVTQSRTQLKRLSSSSSSFLYGPNLTSIHGHWKNHSLTRQTFVGKVKSLLFNILSR